MKYKYTFQKYDDKYLAIVDYIDNKTERRMLWVNECGKTILDLLNNEITKKELINAIMKKYEGDIKVIESCVDEFINMLIEKNFLIIS